MHELSQCGRGGLSWSSDSWILLGGPSTSLWLPLGQIEPDPLGPTAGLGPPRRCAPVGLYCQGLLPSQRPS